MNSINKITKNLTGNTAKLANIKSYELIFVVLLLLYLISGVSTPYNYAPHINNIYMYFSLTKNIYILLCFLHFLYLYL